MRTSFVPLLLCLATASLLAADVAPEDAEKPVGDRPIAALTPATPVINKTQDEAIPEPPPVATRNAPEVRGKYLITVADDFIVEAYKNGVIIPDEKRELLLDRFGATAEKINVEVSNGDWLVFHVVSNHMRWGGSRYFAVAGCLAENTFGFVSDPASADWSMCDDTARVRDFIRKKNAGHNARTLPIETPWGEGDQFIKEYAGSEFAGKALWGRASSTWIKFVAQDANPEVTNSAPVAPNIAPGASIPALVAPRELMQLKRCPVQILSAVYGTGGKNADVTEKVKEHVEASRQMFSVNPRDLGADPNPYWNKGLHITYMKDGVQREQHRNENENVLPESFFGPQDAGELRAWLPESRWFGNKTEIQFHADQTFTTPSDPGVHRWEATAATKLRLIWSADRTENMHFDYTWSGFSEVENGANVFHSLK